MTKIRISTFNVEDVFTQCNFKRKMPMQCTLFTTALVAFALLAFGSSAIAETPPMTEAEAVASFTKEEPRLYTELAEPCDNYLQAAAIREDRGRNAQEKALELPAEDAAVYLLCWALVKSPDKLQSLWESKNGLPTWKQVRNVRDSSKKVLATAQSLPEPSSRVGMIMEEPAPSVIPMDANSSPQSVQLSSQGIFLWGLADVLVKRASDELNVWLFQRVRDEVCTTPKDAGTFRTNALVVDTCSVMMSTPLLSDIPGGVSTLQRAAQRDLEALIMRGSEEGFRLVHARRADATCDKAKELCKQEEELLTYSYLGRVLKLAATDQDLLAALKGAPMQGLPDGFDPSAAPIPTALYQLSFTLQSLPLDGTRIKGADIPYVYGAALVNARAAGITQVGWIPKGLLEIPPALPDVIDGSGKKWKEISNSISEAEQARKQKDTEAAVRSSARALRQMSTLLQSTLSSLCVQGDGTKQGEFCRTLAQSRGWKTLVDATPLLDSIAEGEYGTTVIALTARFEPADSPKLAPIVRRTLAFAVALGKAKNAPAVSAAIESFIAPQGSYRGKREDMRWHLGVNAYAGVIAAQERVEGQTAMSFAPWVPVGIELGHGKEDWRMLWIGPPVASTSLLFQAIDVGALASYRVNKGNIDSASNVEFKQVFSPGVFIVLGFKDAPISLGAGVSFTPAMRRITDSTGVETSANAVRYGLTLALDIPLFP